MLSILNWKNSSFFQFSSFSNSSLRILNNQYQPEGDYQCSSLIRGIRISNGLHIDTQLVSAPVKFRKARISKFEKVNIEVSSNVQCYCIACVPLLDIFRYYFMRLNLKK